MDAIRTLGHGSLAAEDFARLVLDAGIRLVVDIRRFPGSRRFPQFGREQMGTWLPQWGVEYRWLPSLGGRRTPVADSPNVALRNEQFRGYADHMGSVEFTGGVADLLAEVRRNPTAVMCAEALWWNCHRRLLADHLVLVELVAVDHLFHDGRLARHVPAPEAHAASGRVVYDLPAQAQGHLFAEDDRA